ncbi:hypothetical protein Q428_00205 [Fervidicella metallireducens AeB]|uniref:DUF4015 domain-containing protein n=1 Tax=Fervidicella metallireducens AeB TaxID=1403537 RepID=A0A017RYV2_9CLOT|nr:hypothetical protein [Fervidicella metallireducens]EYE89862.1 hypothetical protein Q428_00205 [Fervidicella metallireducens AeB]
MKRYYLIYILISLLLVSCNMVSAEKSHTNIPSPVNTPSKIETKKTDESKINEIHGIYISSINNEQIELIKSLKFNTIFLASPGIRIDKKPYRTDNSALKLLNRNVKLLNKHNINYFIEFTSGPGFSIDGKNSNIFNNKLEAFYFSKMVKEAIKRNINNSNFMGISINIRNSDISETIYYEKSLKIIEEIQKDYPDVKIILNLHPLSFENGFKNIPKINNKNLIIKADIYLKSYTYSGYGISHKTSFTLNRNTILTSLQRLKNVENDYVKDIIITFNAPFLKDSDVLIQDLFEICRTLNFSHVITHNTSDNTYNITKNKTIIKIIKRHNL